MSYDDDRCCRYTFQFLPKPSNDPARLDAIICNQEQIICNQTEQLANQQILIGMLAHNNPASLSANYPEEREDGVYYKTQQLPSCECDRFIVFRDMLNPNFYALFKGILDAAKPVYFVDGSGYPHNVVTAPGGTNVLSNQLVNNEVYPALYQGNDIIITL